MAALAAVWLLASCSTATATSHGTATSTSAPISSATATAGLSGISSASSLTPHGHALSIVALGDSVPAGSACGCTPYPELTAEDLTAPSVAVTANNHAVGGYTTQDVLQQLASSGGDAAVTADVQHADVVEVEVGANDVAHSDTCGNDAACYAPQVTHAEQGVDSIVRRIRELTAGRTVMIVLLDYWSVWLGGSYAQDQGQAYVDAAATVTDALNTGIKTIADRLGCGYVDLRAAFKGPDYAYDETHYLASDGDHPNAAGHAQIATATVAVIRSRLNVP